MAWAFHVPCELFWWLFQTKSHSFCFCRSWCLGLKLTVPLRSRKRSLQGWPLLTVVFPWSAAWMHCSQSLSTAALHWGLLQLPSLVPEFTLFCQQNTRDLFLAWDASVNFCGAWNKLISPHLKLLLQDVIACFAGRVSDIVLKSPEGFCRAHLIKGFDFMWACVDGAGAAA